jgi:hypothetical protein
VGISRSWRDFQSPVEAVLWFPWGCHLHSHLRHRPRSSRLGGCCTLAGVPIVVPRGSYAVVLDRRTAPTAQRQSSLHVATQDTWFYFVASSARKSVWTLVRQLRGPHLSTCA